jgi:hypothetical protein
MSPDPARRREAPSWRIGLAVVAAAAALIGLEFYAVWRASYSAAPAAVGPASVAPAQTAPPHAAVDPASAAEPSEALGAVDEPANETIVGTALAVSGWALSRNGIGRVEVRIDGIAYPAQYGIARADILAARPGFPDSAAAGFSLRRDFPRLSLARHAIEIAAVDKRGTATVLARRSLVPRGALAMWSSELDARPGLAREPFHFLMMTSGVAAGGAAELDTQYRDYISRTQQIGVAVPILYLRTTLGKAGDWRFDPDFDLSRKCGTRAVADDNLTSVIRHVVARRLPVQFILNGGIWSDASCETPDWDATDHLEQDPANCQWTQDDTVFPDNYLKNLPGSTHSPDLARTLTYNVHAQVVRAYKRRNLQAAARIIAAFAREHPDLFVGVALDADTYMNPFFRGRAVFDYNPGMLRQFREWLRGSGPYAGRPADGAPDLSTYRRAEPLTLAAVNRLARSDWKSWNDVQPPRRLPALTEPLKDGERPIWNDPWWNLWDAFRKHVIDLHYDELSEWAHEAGIPRERIFSAQGLIHDDPLQKPFAIRVDSPSRAYDSAGVSVEGAMPRAGHLGAILYGHSARNEVELENGRSLFATIGRMDDGWAIVEYNNTNLSTPTIAPDYSMAYRTFRDAFNYGAREVSAMAWNGSNGIYAGKPDYVPYTAWRNTPAEDAMRDFLVSHADVPHGAQLWTFGTPRDAGTDGWTAERGTLDAGTGFVTLRPDGASVVIVSPPDQVIRPGRIARILLRFAEGPAPSRIRVFAQTRAGKQWTPVGEGATATVALAWPAGWGDERVVERIKLELSMPPGAGPATLSRVLLYPREPTRH